MRRRILRVCRPLVVLFWAKSDSIARSLSKFRRLVGGRRFQRASFVRFVDRLAHVLPLGFEELVDGRGESRLADEVRTACCSCVEASELLVGPACARFEAIQALIDAVFDGRVVADIEVKVSERSGGPPVPTVEGISFSDIECAGDPFILVSSHDEDKSGSEGIRKLFKGFAVEVLPSPVMGVDGGEVEGVHRFDEVFGDFVAGEGMNRNALGKCFPSLSSDLISTFAPESAQVGFE